MVTSDIPQDILMDIFLRLPAKCVGKCRCLSKQWLTLLSTPQFIKSHLTRKPQQESLILMTLSGSIHTIASIKEEDAYCRKLELPYRSVHIVGSFDGLVLLRTEQCKMVLVNPITLQQVEIPNLPLASVKKQRCRCSFHGFGYDRFNNDYNIFTLSHYLDNYNILYETFVDVYSMKKGVWKRAGIFPYRPYISGGSSGAFVNDAIHWLVYGEPRSRWFAIAAFNLIDEVFYVVPAPNGIEEKFRYDKLEVLGGCLCILDSGDPDFGSREETDFWVMKEYDSEKSWTKFSINIGHRVMRPLRFIGDDEVLLLIVRRSLVVYNQKEGTLLDMIVDGAPTNILKGDSFVESLLSPASLSGT